MRLFFGIFPPESVLDEAAAIRDRVREHVRDERARWVKTPQLHLTLQFLGEHETDATALEAAREVSARHAAFRIGLSGVGDFGHVYFLGVAHPAPLVALADDLGQALRARGFALDDRPYHPHLTIARIRSAKKVDLEAETAAFDVTSFALIESHGGQYSTRETLTLGQTRSPP